MVSTASSMLASQPQLGSERLFRSRDPPGAAGRARSRAPTLPRGAHRPSPTPPRPHQERRRPPTPPLSIEHYQEQVRDRLFPDLLLRPLPTLAASNDR